MGDAPASLLFGSDGSLLELLFLCSLLVAFFLPLLALYATLTLRGIRRQLKRVADALESGDAAPRGGLGL